MIFEDELIFVERETSEIPWVKIFTKTPFKELTDCDEATQKRIFEAVLTTEKVMRKFYNPTKINIASFSKKLVCLFMILRRTLSVLIKQPKIHAGFVRA